MKIRAPKVRITWGFDPVSRVLPSKERYSRKKEKNELKKGLMKVFLLRGGLIAIRLQMPFMPFLFRFTVFA